MRGIKYVSEALRSGYGEAARGYMRHLREAGIALSWAPMVVGRSLGLWLEPFEGHNLEDEEFGELVNRDIEYEIVIVHLTAEYLTAWEARERGKKIIAMTVWELDKLPETWRSSLNGLEGVMVPCKWNAEVFRANGVTRPIAVVPHILPRRVSQTRGPVAKLQPDDYVFYSVAAWRERNAPHLTLQSFLTAFRDHEKAVLVLKTSVTNERAGRPEFWWYRVKRHFASVERDIHAIRTQTKSSARIEVFSEPWPRSHVQELHHRGDCYVSLTRAEGWGLGAYEAAGAGNPVIVTGHGGQLEFLPRSLAYHVDFRLVPYHDPSMERGYCEKLGAYWAEPDINSGAELMRYVFTHREEARERGAALQRFVRDHFDAKVITENMLAFVRSLAS